MLSSIQIVSKEDADVERRKISKKEKKKKKKKNKEKEKKKRNKERKKVKEDDDDDDDDDDDESADSEDSDEGEVKRVSGNLQSSTKGVFENKTADALLSSREVEKEEDKDGFLAKALLSSDVTKKDTKSKTQIEREREEERVREVCASRELAGKSARDDGEPVGVGDGGASWRLKALRRAKERAVKEGRNLEEEVQNRFGSVRQLVSGIGGKAAHGRSHLHAKYERKGADGRRGGVKRIHDDDDDDDALIKSSLREASTHHNRAADESKNMPVSFNAFSSDGSFMDSFDEQKRHQQKEQKQNQQQEERKPSREVEGNTSAYTNTDDVRSNLPSSKNLSAAQMLRMRLAGGKKGAAKGKEEENVSLPLVTEDGRAMPGVFGKPTSLEMEHDDVNRREFKKPKQTQMYDGNRSGEKVRYYRNDDASLRDLVAQEKHGGDKLYENYDANAADNIARKKKYKESDMNVDDEYDHDIGIEMYENRRTKMSLAKQQQKAKQESIRDFKQSTRVQSRCLFCEDSENMPRNMQIAHGYHTFLMLPPVGRLVPGHCVIVPKAHARSTRQVDEDVWEEIRNFRKCLVKMFVAQGKECCFIETAMHLNSPSNRFHAVVECIPLQSNLMAKARMYFKKAMDESESEWSQHNSKKCLEMKPPKNLKTSIPENFPYFVVEFNMSGGYLHAIDEESRWNRDFGIEILGGLLKKNSSSSKKEKLAPGKLEKERREFLSMWEKFDWSKALYYK
jgi:hypothetical protein